MLVGLFAAIFFALVTLSVVEVPVQQKVFPLQSRLFNKEQCNYLGLQNANI